MTSEISSDPRYVAHPPLLKPTELESLVRAGEITTVMVGVPDMLGRLKGKLHEARGFMHGFPSEWEMCGYVLATDVDMNPQPGYALTGWHDGFGDLHVIPDGQAMRRLPYLPGTVLVHGDAVHHNGRPVDVGPRQMLRKQLQALASFGLQAKVGVEGEFMLYNGTQAQVRRRGYRGLTPVSPYNLDYALDHPPALSSFFEDLRAALHGAGCPVEAIKTEGAPGQVEVTWPYGHPMRACDDYTVHKHAVRHLAERHDMAPTFMAAPRTGVGSGLHLHVSLWRDEDDSAFYAPQSDVLPDLLQHSIAGLVEALPHMVLLCAPSANSYKRFKPRSFAPTSFTWGRDNRSCAVRVTGEEANPHLEVRLAGADANPYLALASVIAAIIHGIRNEPKLPEPCTGDGYDAADAIPVPNNLDEALTDFAESQIAQQAFGTSVVDHYAHAAEIELAVAEGQVTDWEVRRGFDRA
ncbi:glutamine synthetase family protein [Streptomyces tauricus]|uniref:Glutamine synthetase family protein n=1 Tax=Streptomyces tauricus TaxID=68274 RepID=A0ABZ1JD77_9ACTN|nr:glutamine synthetase family protein [Streptomyces tauricus]